MAKPAISVTGFWMRNLIDGRIEVLIEHDGKWLVVFGSKGPGPVARDQDQLIDHMIHAGGVQNLIDTGNVHGFKNKIAEPQLIEAWTLGDKRVVMARGGKKAKTKTKTKAKR